MSVLTAFKENDTYTVGVELELQLVDLKDFNLAMEAKDFLRRLSEIPLPAEIKPEITLAMIEFNSSIHLSYPSLIHELRSLRNIVAREAAQTHIGICGGGAHPFQKWKEQRIFPTERFNTLSEHYGYLAKQLTTFGQHIHIGCKNGDEALYLCHAMARYIPQFIALSAASPFHQGVDTRFDCSRLTTISSFPLSGTPPLGSLTWKEFELYFEKMFNLGVVKSMKDFYWDIRPKPEYGTVELRICDTPLTVDKAADLAAYAQMLIYWLIENQPPFVPDIYLTYSYNRFNAARYGMDAVFIDPKLGQHIPISEQILDTCKQLEPYAKQLNCQPALAGIRTAAYEHKNDASWLRNKYYQFGSLNDMVRSQTALWQANNFLDNI